ncbi:hypothetical protein BMT54_09180 [Pasteurellaceae bacterium 15-036681]|nr:hypothetical protein BMT54_09180 [Pasteurellaceae bacterium 15-036681]
MQQRINQIQQTYREFLELQQKLVESQQQWQRSVELMKELEQFYYGDDYMEIRQQMDDGEEYDLTTQGEYSVMSEDALWNSFHEYQQLLWKQLRFAVSQLDREPSE